MDIVIIGIDLGKNSCSLTGMDASGRVVLRRRMRRNSLERFTKGLGRCIIAMEACCGAHHLGRIFATQGHEVRLMSPEYVRPYVKSQKNDDLDAEAIAEAAMRPTMRFVEVKSQAQSDIQALHRARERLVSERTALINHPAGAAAGAWDCGATGTTQTGRGTLGLRGRGRDRGAEPAHSAADRRPAG